MNKKKKIVDKTMEVKEKSIHWFENKIRWQLLIIILLPVIVYFKVGSFGLIDDFDDTAIIIEHQDILSNINKIGEVFKTDAFLDNKGESFYRPIQNVSFMLDAQISGKDAWMYHLSNLLIHLLTCITLYYFLRSLNFKNITAFFFTLLFSVHPLFASAVSWVPARGDLLIAFFSLLLFLSFKKHLATNKIIYYLLHIILFSLVIFTKETMVMLPLLLLFYYFGILKNKFELKKLFPYLLVWVTIIFIYLITRSRIIHGDYSLKVFGALPFSKNLPVISIMLGKFLIPSGLSTLPLFDWMSFIVGTVILTMLLFITYKSIKEKKWVVVFGFTWFLLFTVPPMLYRVILTEYKYWYLEHRTYLPMIGLIIVLAFFINEMINKEMLSKKLFNGVSIVVIFVFSILATLHADDYKDSITFFTAAANHDNAGAYNLRGCVYADEGDFQDALTDFNKAIEIAPEFPDLYFDRGKLYSEAMQDHVSSEADFSKAIYADSTYTDAYIKRSTEKKYLGNTKGAFDDLYKAEKYDSLNNEIYYRLGNLFSSIKKYDNAVAYYTRAIALKNDYSEAYQNRGSVLHLLHHSSEAIQDLKKSIQMNPGYVNAYFDLGSVYLDIGMADSAIVSFDSTIRLSPNFAEAYYKKGKAFQLKNDAEKACNTWQELLKLGSPEIKDTIAKYCNTASSTSKK
jgi:tetratricopeptide (TPR) repeat protein